ncbi:hypothetical protein FSP39_000948 [Pinctada imbricata]|uniref:Uncharacterized protein n=1 Tax=Pinctada imbricata TaxID=66713 RepID=A0AA89BWL1_PINIB|nr:hypothetical protein FSP39_000948 [Pinctada imbricata]
MTNVNNVPQSSTTSPAPTTPPLPAGPTTLSSGRNGNDSSTDTIAAITVAVVAVIIVLTILFVSRAFIKRRRARQGERMDQPVPTVSTGIMGTRKDDFYSRRSRNKVLNVIPKIEICVLRVITSYLKYPTFKKYLF